MKIYTSTYISPLGAIVIESDGETLTGLRFEESQTGTMEKIIKADDTEIPVITEVRKWLDDYFAGKEPRNVPKLNPQGTAFLRKVWQALLTISYGRTITYGELARLIGCRSAQAVGQAVGHNPIALIIPCHRVVGANGALGGYAFGVERKRKLLEREAR
ncbi:MAG: methylated-DNA--[Paludibacteraceae bacterium]|nr:methylated-DNA--[protein]-cysteine S-methyltransferase [Paludibacteraceae bacterium]MBR1481240.1 methylated-DNA--[protein]-cysteine S-methyltransferase [Paludibacteraceae bacterium]